MRIYRTVPYARSAVSHVKFGPKSDPRYRLVGAPQRTVDAPYRTVETLYRTVEALFRAAEAQLFTDLDTQPSDGIPKLGGHGRLGRREGARMPFSYKSF